MATGHGNPGGLVNGHSRRLTEDDAEAIAEHTVSKFIDQLQNEETVGKIVTVWQKQLDQSIGRSVRRFVFWVLGTVIIVAALQFDQLGAVIAKFLGR